mmetsp:Transcript_123077/g.230104  ORF Transcript_123077/g.230104 Transcript_123077/m.230104 type:complete len:121 (-) Transcript_123077:1426-1788(-)
MACSTIKVTKGSALCIARSKGALTPCNVYVHVSDAMVANGATRLQLIAACCFAIISRMSSIPPLKHNITKLERIRFDISSADGEGMAVDAKWLTISSSTEETPTMKRQESNGHFANRPLN